MNQTYLNISVSFCVPRELCKHVQENLLTCHLSDSLQFLISFLCLQDFIFESLSFGLDRFRGRNIRQKFVIFSRFTFLACCETLVRYIIHRPLSILLSRCLLSGFLCNWGQFYRNSLFTFQGSCFLRVNFIHSHEL